ncbi:branched-chain amino acid ABC transporter permease [Sphaerimonospora mesophila]|uniref:branched-chain amino acid ABC transporter permease n=1 Tax=Sphaerimonospora mesophila TaxID=37483 RepID=UPI0006E256FD
MGKRRSPLTYLAGAGGLLVAGAFPFLYSDFYVFHVTIVLIYGIAILGLVLLTGLTGTISIGHGAIFGIGAYGCAITMDRLGLPYPLALCVSTALGALVGLALGIPSLRLRGIYLGLVTLALSLVFPPLLMRFSGLTGGASGYSLPPVDSPVGALTISQWFYLVTVVIGLIAVLVLQNLKHSARGRALQAIRRSEPLAAAMGVSVGRERIVVFVLSAAYAALAGGLFALVAGAISPDAFTFNLSANLLVGAVVGGVASPVGALLGGALISFVPAVTATLPRSLPQYAFAAAVLLVLYLRPDGLASLPDAVKPLIRRWRRTRSAGPAADSTVDQNAAEARPASGPGDDAAPQQSLPPAHVRK